MGNLEPGYKPSSLYSFKQVLLLVDLILVISQVQTAVIRNEDRLVVISQLQMFENYEFIFQ